MRFGRIEIARCGYIEKHQQRGKVKSARVKSTNVDFAFAVCAPAFSVSSERFDSHVREEYRIVSSLI